jgi:hypothetical protein
MNEPEVTQQTITISWPQPNGLGNSALLVHDFYEWFVTPCSQ